MIARHFKLWGPLRSGTNYLGRVMELNFKDIQIHHNEGGWKHGPPQHSYYKENTLAGLHRLYDGHLLIIKSPLAWAASMYRYSIYSDKYLDPIILAQRWNQYARELYTFSWRDDAILIKYEALLENFDLTMKDIATTFNLPQPEEWKDEPGKMLRGGDMMKGDATVSKEIQNKSYYLNREYINDLGKANLTIMRNFIDPYLILLLNYHEHF